MCFCNRVVLCFNHCVRSKNFDDWLQHTNIITRINNILVYIIIITLINILWRLHVLVVSSRCFDLDRNLKWIYGAVNVWLGHFKRNHHSVTPQNNWFIYPAIDDDTWMGVNKAFVSSYTTSWRCHMHITMCFVVSTAEF